MSKKDFTAQVGRIRALESRLLTDEQVERMLSAEDASNSLKILNDLDWASFLGEAEKPEDYGKIIDEGLIEIKNIIIEMLDDKDDLDFLWLLFDLQNAKILTKALVKNDNPDDIIDFLSPLGVLSSGRMRRLIFEQKRINNFEWLLPVINKIQSHYNTYSNPEIIEWELHFAFFPLILEQVEKTKSELIMDFFQRLIDIENIKTFATRSHHDSDFSSTLLLEGGSINTSDILQANDFGVLIEKIPDFTTREALSRELLGNEKIDYVVFEKILDEFLFNSLKPSKIASEEIDAVFAYFWTKNRNAGIIRAIMIGKLNFIPEEQIRKWLRTTSLTFA